MPRPKLKSDDEVLEAATVVLKRCGPIEFTLSGVAKEVGLPRSVNPALHQPRYAAGEDDGARRRAGAALPECDTDRRRAARALGIFAGARSEHEHSQRLLGELSHLWYELRCRSYARLRSSGTARWWRDPQATAPVLLRQLSCSCTRSSLARRCSGPSIRMVS